MSEPQEETTTAATTKTRPRGVAYASVWTAQAEPIAPAEIADLLYARGFMPGVTDAGATRPALADAGLADARFAVGAEGFRFISLSSSKGNGCLVTLAAASEADLPDDYLSRRTVPHPSLVYRLDAGGPGNSDRTLCENIAEVIFLLTDGLVEIGGLGVKGNRPVLHNRTWLGKIKTSS